MTAAAFARGLLELNGEITPILTSLVRKDKAVDGLLDDTSGARDGRAWRGCAMLALACTSCYLTDFVFFFFCARALCLLPIFFPQQWTGSKRCCMQSCPACTASKTLAAPLRQRGCVLPSGHA